MIEESITPPTADEEESGRAWRPSRKPDRHFGGEFVTSQSKIVERPDRGGPFGALRDLLKRPTAKAIVAVCLFVFAIILFDATINGGSWTERVDKPRPVAAKKVRPSGG